MQKKSDRYKVFDKGPKEVVENTCTKMESKVQVGVDSISGTEAANTGVSRNSGANNKPQGFCLKTTTEGAKLSWQ